MYYKSTHITRSMHFLNTGRTSETRFQIAFQFRYELKYNDVNCRQVTKSRTSSITPFPSWGRAIHDVGKRLPTIFGSGRDKPSTARA